MPSGEGATVAGRGCTLKHKNAQTTKTHTLDKKWIIEVIRWELNPLTCNWIRKTENTWQVRHSGIPK